jgi:hypothetical protein
VTSCRRSLLVDVGQDAFLDAVGSMIQSRVVQRHARSASSRSCAAFSLSATPSRSVTATLGFSIKKGRKYIISTTITLTDYFARTVAVRGVPASKAISPKKSPDVST